MIKNIIMKIIDPAFDYASNFGKQKVNVELSEIF